MRKKSKRRDVRVDKRVGGRFGEQLSVQYFWNIEVKGVDSSRELSRDELMTKHS